MAGGRAMAGDVGRRVVQCACGRTAIWRGEDAVLAAGWHRRWAPGPDGELAASWVCEGCYEPPAPPPTPTGLPKYLRTLVLNGDQDLAREQLAAMAVNEPARFAGVLGEIEAELEWMKPGRRRSWRAWVRAQRRPKRRAA